MRLVPLHLLDTLTSRALALDAQPVPPGIGEVEVVKLFEGREKLRVIVNSGIRSFDGIVSCASADESACTAMSRPDPRTL